jgi:hypothetical protein
MQPREYNVEVTLFAESTKTGKPTKWSPSVTMHGVFTGATKEEAETKALDAVREGDYDRFSIEYVQMLAFAAKARLKK